MLSRGVCGGSRQLQARQSHMLCLFRWWKLPPLGLLCDFKGFPCGVLRMLMALILC